MTSLPIDDALPALQAALTTHTQVVLEAPPGAGKTTRVPLALLDAPWRGDQRIIMLEPRRLAARAAAHFMARTLGERIGARVGFRVRGDTQVSARTRVEVVTEGVLTRMLLADPTLDGYGAVLFDEFHERSLHADLGLALALETQQHLRPDLRLLIMSATLDGDRVAQWLGGTGPAAPVVRSDGRIFPVETIYRPPRPDERAEAAVARVVREALASHEGDVLVFLPGMGEQRRVAERLPAEALPGPVPVVVHLLHGSMPLGAQDAAIAPAPPGERKVVLATSIAETSLTIEGVRVVVDGGWSRLPRYDARAGLTRLHTVRVSRASATQRRGRAGRVAPGVCYRLWDAAEDHALVPRTRPELLEADLSGLALTLAEAGVADPSTLRWLDVPPAGPFAQARDLLTQLGALDATGRITPHGQAMAAEPTSPRLAHMLVRARSRGQGALAAVIVELLEERAPLRQGNGLSQTDLRLPVEALRGGALPAEASEEVGALLALAYPDRVAQRRPGGEPRFLLRNGTGAVVARGDALADAPYIAIAELEGAPPEYRVARAAPITREEIEEDFADQIVQGTVVEWHAPSRTVRATRRMTLGALVLDERQGGDGDPAQVRAVLVQEMAKAGIAALPWGARGEQLRARLACLHAHRPDWPDVSDAALTATLEEWLAPHLDGVRSWRALEGLDFSEMLLAELPWTQRQAMDRLVPTHLEVPSGSRIALDYTDPMAPVLAVKLQEVFGWTSTPMLLDGQLPVTLHLLSPAQRPVQVTRDLAGFWQSSYFAVRKELRGRYPRHPWPEDPLTAEATRRAKPRGT